MPWTLGERFVQEMPLASDKATLFLLVLNALLLLVSWRAAKAAKLNAETAEKAFLLSRRAPIDAQWEILSDEFPDRAGLAVTVSELAGVPTELLRAEGSIHFLNADCSRSTEFTIQHWLASGTTFTGRVGVPVDLSEVENARGLRPLAFIAVTLTVTAHGINDPRQWHLDCTLDESETGFTVTCYPPRPIDRRAVSRSFLQRCGAAFPR